MLLDLQPDKIKTDKKTRALLRSRGVDKLFFFVNREGTRVSGSYTMEELLIHKSPSVAKFIEAYNYTLNKKIEGLEDNLKATLGYKEDFKTIDLYHVKLQKIASSIVEQILRKISFLAEVDYE